MAGSLITVTSLTFSLTVVTLQLASSQFSPRLLRTFTRDRVVHLTLAIFLATFTYALTVLRTVRTSGDSRTVFVPQIAVTTAFLLALVSVLALVLFLAHLAAEIRVETALRNVHAEATETVQRVLQKRDPSAASTAPPVAPADAELLCSRSSGFLVRVDEQALLRAVTDAGAVLLLSAHPGRTVEPNRIPDRPRSPKNCSPLFSMVTPATRVSSPATPKTVAARAVLTPRLVACCSVERRACPRGSSCRREPLRCRSRAGDCRGLQ